MKRNFLYSPDDRGAGNNSENETTMDKPEPTDEKEQNPNQKEDESPKKYTDDDIKKIIADYETKIQSAIDETEEKSRMKPDEKQEYETNKRESELLKREQELAAKQLTMETQELLGKNSLDREFTKYVIGADLEETLKRIKEFKPLFDQKVQAAVEKRLVGKTPPAGFPVKSGDSVRNQFKNSLGGVN